MGAYESSGVDFFQTESHDVPYQGESGTKKKKKIFTIALQLFLGREGSTML